MACSAGTLHAQPEFGSWAAISAGTPTLIGATRQVSLFLAAVRYSQEVVRRPAFSLRYTADVLPVARMTTSSRTVAGKGAAPVGLEIRFRPSHRLQPSGALSGGFIYFNHEVPEPGGARFNFTADLGAGLHYVLTRFIGMDAGYRYHHLSNAYRASRNPGFDSNLFFAGIQFRK
jgi:opacity protein-like surface antigen